MSKVRWEANRTWSRWKLVGRQPLDVGKALPPWTDAMQSLYRESQEVVHVITGNLKRSGRVQITRTHRSIEGVLEYGMPYASDEAARGGDHDYLQRAWEAVGDEFGDATMKALDALIDRSYG